MVNYVELYGKRAGNVLVLVLVFFGFGYDFFFIFLTLLKAFAHRKLYTASHSCTHNDLDSLYISLSLSLHRVHLSL